MELDIRLREGEVITDREKFLLSVIRYLDDMESWYLDEDPNTCRALEDEFGFSRKYGDEENT